MSSGDPLAAEADAAAYELPDDGNESVCGACNGQLPDGPLICCENCPAAFHPECAGYASLDAVPDGNWLCWTCAKELKMKHPFSNKALRAEVGQVVLLAHDRPPRFERGEVFYRARVVAKEGVVLTLTPAIPTEGAKERERVAANSGRLWAGSPAPCLWESVAGHPALLAAKSRVYAIDFNRLQGSYALRHAQHAQQAGGGGGDGDGDNVAGPSSSMRASASHDGGTASAAAAAASSAADDGSSAEAGGAGGSGQGRPQPNSSAGGASGAVTTTTTAPAADVLPPPDEATFVSILRAFHAARGKQLPTVRVWGRIMNVYALWTLAMEWGGYEALVVHKKWAVVARALGASPTCTTISYDTKQAYTKLLLEFEKATRAGTTGVPLPPPTRLDAMFRGEEGDDARPVGGGRQQKKRAAAQDAAESGGAKRAKAAPAPAGLADGPCRMLPTPAARGLPVGGYVEVRSMAPGSAGAWVRALLVKVAPGSAMEGGLRFLVEYLSVQQQYSRAYAAAQAQHAGGAAGAAPPLPVPLLCPRAGGEAGVSQDAADGVAGQVLREQAPNGGFPKGSSLPKGEG